jgi:hypothetical protein
VPGTAAELAVRNSAQADLFLFADRLPNRVVLDRAQGGGVDVAGRVLLARLVEALRPQQAADVVGPERWAGSFLALDLGCLLLQWGLLGIAGSTWTLYALGRSAVC